MPTASISVNLSGDLMEKLQELAAEKGIDANELASLWLEESIEIEYPLEPALL